MDKEEARMAREAVKRTKVEAVKKAVALIEWLDSVPETLLGTRALEDAWDEAGEVVDTALWMIGAKRDEETHFVCYEQDEGPKNELREWLEVNGGTDLANDSGD